jgi:phosphatase NudJ
MSRYKPNTTVACVIHSQGQFLLVEELIEGQVRYNQPAGHLEAGESLISACRREVNEETGLNIMPLGLVSIYQFSASDALAFVRFTFFAELKAPIQSTPLDSAITAIHWLSRDEVANLGELLRSPLVLKSIDDYLHQPHFPLALLNSDLLTIAQTEKP